MNKVICEVEKFWSYQTLVDQARNRRFRNQNYKMYRFELAPYLRNLKKIKNPNAPIYIGLTFNVKGAVKPEEWKLIMKETGNTAKICHSKAEALEHKKDRHRIEFFPEIIRFGATGDDDNIAKPIKDLLEDLEIIPNDNQGCKTYIDFTYNNKNNTLEVEVEELVTVIDKNGVYRFERAE